MQNIPPTQFLSLPCYPDNSSISQMTILLLHLLLLPILSLSRNTTNIPDCQKPTICGDITVNYPFYIQPANETEFELLCGYPQYDLSCTDDILYSDPYKNYRITRIDDDNRTFTVADNTAFESTCPKLVHNITIQRIANFTDDVTYLTFFMDCRDNASLNDHRISCYSGNSSSYVFAGEEGGQLLPEKCKDVIVAPVLRSNLVNANLTQNFTEILKLGFDMNWDHSQFAECSDCDKSGGYCALYNNGQNKLQSTCLCDGNWPRYDCKRGKSLNRASKVLIAAFGSVAGLGFLVVGCWLFRRKNQVKKKKRSSSNSTTLIQSILSEFSSDSKVDKGNNDAYSETHIFSYKELEEATDGFSSDREVGDGGFGAVYKGILKDGRIVAVKRPYENNFKRFEQFINEIAILKHIRHPNLVSLYGCTTHDSQQLLLVYEFVPNGTVADHLTLNKNPYPLAAERGTGDGGEMNWVLRMNIAVEIAEALTYLHSFVPQIIHRDVKTNNILLDNDYHVKVADFGLSRLFPLDVTHVSTAPQGTPGYVDPEYYQCYQLTDKSDVFSFGVVLVELISSKPAVDITRSRHEINLSNMAMNRISNGLVHELADPMLEYETDLEVRRTIEQVAEVAFLCLQSDKDLRPPMKDVKEKLVDIVSKSKWAAVVSDPTRPSHPPSPVSYSNTTTISTLDFHSNGSNSTSPMGAR